MKILQLTILLTLPMDDPFWDKYFPPNGWNCRCTVVQVRKGKYPTSDPELAMKRGDNCTASVKQQIFRYNPGKTMELFPPKHPYYKAPAEAKKTIENIVRYEQNKALYNRLKEDENYFDVEFDEKSGGVKATHVGHISHNEENSQKFFNGLSSDDLERLCQNQLFRMGHAAILRNESELSANGNFITSLDLELNGKLMDIRSITQNNPVGYGYALLDKNKQIKKYNYAYSDNVDSVCLYFHDASFYSKERIERGIDYFKNAKRTDGTNVTIRIKYIYCVVNGLDKIKIYEI